MSRKDAINNLFMKPREQSAPAVSKGGERVRTGAISAMGASLQEMSENAKQASQLQKQLAEGEAVIFIETEKIDQSPIADRIPIDVDPDFTDLVKSIDINGQQVPILVRPSQQATGRFQIAYGRRRLRAVELLGRPVKAIVRDLSDGELVVAQGRENLDRKDLSFIEKAFFAKNLEDDGYERNTVVAALATDKSDVSRYIAVARRVPEEIVKRIGPAPKAGRARWLALAERLDNRDALSTAREVLEAPALKRADSDARFSAVLGALDDKVRRKYANKSDTWSTPQGKRAARIEARDGKTSLVFEDKVVPDFARYISAKLDDLYHEFQSNGDGGGEG